VPHPVFLLMLLSMAVHQYLTKFYVSNATSIGNQTAKFQLNLAMQTIATAAFVRSPQNVRC